MCRRSLGSSRPGYRSGRELLCLMLSTPATIPWDVVHPESSDELALRVAVAWLRAGTPDEAGRRE